MNAPTAPATVSGTLVVIFMKAKNLPNRRTLGKQNPYCIGRIGFDAKRCPAEERGGQSPKWDHEVRFTITEKSSPNSSSSNLSLGSRSSLSPSPPPSAPATIFKLTVLDENEGKPELIGDCVIDLTPALKSHPDDGWDKWHELEYKGKYAGEVYLEMTFYSTQPVLPKKKLKTPPKVVTVVAATPKSEKRKLNNLPIGGAISSFPPPTDLTYHPLPTPQSQSIPDLSSSSRSAVSHLAMPEPPQDITLTGPPFTVNALHPHGHALPNPADYQPREMAPRPNNHRHSYSMGGGNYMGGNNIGVFSQSHGHPSSGSGFNNSVDNNQSAHSRSLNSVAYKPQNYNDNHEKPQNFNNHNNHHSATRSLNSNSFNLGYPTLESLSLQDLDLPRIPNDKNDREKQLPNVNDNNGFMNHSIPRKPVGSSTTATTTAATTTATPATEFGTTQKINKVFSNIQRRQVESSSDNFTPFSADDYNTLSSSSSLLPPSSSSSSSSSPAKLKFNPQMSQSNGAKMVSAAAASDDILDASTYAPEPVLGKGRSLPQIPGDPIDDDSSNNKNVGMVGSSVYLGQGQWDLSQQLNAKYSDSIYHTVMGQQQQQQQQQQHHQQHRPQQQQQHHQQQQMDYNYQKPSVPPKIPLGMTPNEFIAAEYSGKNYDGADDEMMYYNYI